MIKFLKNLLRSTPTSFADVASDLAQDLPTVYLWESQKSPTSVIKEYFATSARAYEFIGVVRAAVRVDLCTSAVISGNEYCIRIFRIEYRYFKYKYVVTIEKRDNKITSKLIKRRFNNIREARQYVDMLQVYLRKVPTQMV